jgi:hypothetical protein
MNKGRRLHQSPPVAPEPTPPPEPAPAPAPTPAKMMTVPLTFNANLARQVNCLLSVWLLEQGLCLPTDCCCEPSSLLGV